MKNLFKPMKIFNQKQLTIIDIAYFFVAVALLVAKKMVWIKILTVGVVALYGLYWLVGTLNKEEKQQILTNLFSYIAVFIFLFIL